jgi:WD40 repeat protein
MSSCVQSLLSAAVDLELLCVFAIAAVTSITFSKCNPHILAVGMHDGTIAVYDVRSRQLLPLMSSTAQTGKHLGPVWKVRCNVQQSSVNMHTMLLIGGAAACSIFPFPPDDDGFIWLQNSSMMPELQQLQLQLAGFYSRIIPAATRFDNMSGVKSGYST